MGIKEEGKSLTVFAESMAASIDYESFRTIKFTGQVDSLDYSMQKNQLLCSSSNLEGDMWDGSISIINLSSDVDSSELSVNNKAGCSSAKFIGPDHEYVRISLSFHLILSIDGTNFDDAFVFQQVVAALDDGNVAVYSSVDLKELYKLEGHDDIVSCLGILVAFFLSFFLLSFLFPSFRDSSQLCCHRFYASILVFANKF